MSAHLFSAEIVHLSISNAIDPKLIASSPDIDMVEAAKGRMADALAAFIVKHSATVGCKDNGMMLVELRVSVLMPKAPPNVPSTKILFYEREANPTSTPDHAP